MTDRKLVMLFAGGLVVVGGLLWVLALTVASPKNQVSHRSNLRLQDPSTNPPAGNPSPAVLTNASDALKRARRYLEPPTTKEAISSAQIALRSIPASAAEYKEAQKLLVRSERELKAAEARSKAEELTKLRDKLETDYQRLLSESNPHLNYITTRLSKHKGGFTLWGVHTYFTRYTFSIGDDAKIVTAWIDQNGSDLKRAGILRVGVISNEDWGGGCWFDLR